MLFIVLIIVGKKPKRFHQMIYFEIGDNWCGGFNCGWVAVVHKNPSEYILRHEHGHFIQNTFFGVFELVIQIMSIIRYWYRKIKKKKEGKKYNYLTEYDGIWFERQATDFGYKYLE